MPLMLTLAVFLCAAEPTPVAKPVTAPASEDTPAALKKVPVYPKTVTVLKDVAYLGGTRKEKADIYSPLDHDKAKPLPGIIVIHGGGFNDGDKARGRELNISENLTLKGYVCMSINYKLRRTQGQVTWPQSVHDAKAAVRYLRKEAANLGVDPEKIGVIGCSAGCNLSMMLATTGPADGFDAVKGEPYQDVSARVACAIGFYGAVDLMNYHDMKMFAKTREEAPELYKKGSPITYLDAKDPPMLLVHGTADVTVPLSQSETYLKVAKAQGAPCVLEVIPDAPHTFDLQPKQRDLRPLVTAFFDQHLKGKTAK
ncbi:MAG: alpha/beta hydrolase [Verrucomicrobia bacterium]|nr:alpha/beta hydrolase [Verrucomicrobiota bacterium]